VQVLQIAVVEETANHGRRDVFRALLVKLVAGHELKIAIGASQPSLETSLQKTVGLDHDSAGSAAIRMAICQPEERHPLSLALPTAVATPRLRSPFSGLVREALLDAWPCRK
jgi:hypothetical protein